MLSGRVVGHQVQNQLHVPAVQLGNERFHVRHSAELVHNVPVVGNVVAVVLVGTLVAGAEPYGVDAKVLQVVQPGENALQVPDAVTVAVLKAPGVDLIDSPAEKIPIFFRHVRSSFLPDGPGRFLYYKQAPEICKRFRPKKLPFSSQNTTNQDF